MRTWIVDIGHKININQFAGKKGVGTEHLLVMMVDKILHMLDKPGATAVIFSAIDWMGAFDRLDPTITVSKLITMGVRSSLIPTIIEFLEDRQMSVNYNGAASKWHTLIGGGPQGSWIGQNCYISASDDAASWLEDEYKYKYCDDLSIVELIMVGNILTDYNFSQHVASDVAIGQQYLEPKNIKMQEDLNKLAVWTNANLMKLNEKKTNYMIFSRQKKSFSTRLTINGNLLERKSSIKILGVWLQEDGGWQTNVDQMCKSAFARISMLTKLSYAGVSRSDLVHLYKMFIRSKLEYCVVPMHSSLTGQQAASLERCQSVALRIILQNDYSTYSEALKMAGIETLESRRKDRCLTFSQKCLKHPTNNRIFPLNENMHTRNSEHFKVNFAHTEAYKNSAVPFCQRLLNEREGLRRAQRAAG